MRKVVGKILMIVSLGCVALAFASLFLPLSVNFTKFIEKDTEVIVGTGSVTSLFTCLLCLPCTVLCNFGKDYTGEQVIDHYRMNNSFSSRGALPGLIQFLVIAALIICTVVILVLLLMNKYKGKKKVFLSIIFLFLLVVTTASMLFEKAIVDLSVGGILKGLTGDQKIEYIRMTGLMSAPMCYMICGGAALVINVIGLILIRGDKQVKVKANPVNKNK